jgi:hypothetical protein
MDIYDILLSPFYLLLVLFLAYKYKAKHQHEHPAYKYFLPGLVAKIFGAIALGLVYFYYYGGGDTINYHQTASGFVNVLLKSPEDFLYLYFGSPSPSEFYLFSSEDGFVYWVRDQYAYFSSKLFFLFELLSFKTYMPATILVASVCYFPVWKLYLLFLNEYPKLVKPFAYSLLFVPSVVFWGSGIMKDSITFSSVCLYVYGFYWFFIKKKRKLSFIVYISLAVFLLLSIKPYISFALLPGSIIWLVTLQVAHVKNALIKVLIAPVVLIIGGILITFVMNYMSSSLGKYSIDNVFDTAKGAQQDLKQSYYGGNTFDIGDYEPTVSGILSVAHKAIFAALFRPSLLDVRNIVMLLSALENAFLLLFTLYLLIKLSGFRFFVILQSEPLALFSFIFALFFALSVGVSISNFGTLVRLKIPCVPFFLSSLIIVNELMNTRRIES